MVLFNPLVYCQSMILSIVFGEVTLGSFSTVL